MIQIVKISKSVPLTMAFQTVCTAHFQRHLLIRNIHIVNTTANDVSVQVTMTPAGVAPGQAYSLLWDFNIPGNDFIEFGEGMDVLPGASISALASANNAMVLHLAGIEE